MSAAIEINHNWLKTADIKHILDSRKPLVLSETAKEKIALSHAFLQKEARGTAPVYGVNTGFGSLCNTSVPPESLAQLQRNLVMSHACGTGEELNPEVVKIMLLLKIHALSLGFSGVSTETIERLIAFYNNDVLPVVYTQGSLGASGDLAPLAHLILPLIGKGEVNYQGKKLSGEALLQKFSWQPLQLGAKEGLALLNGTQYMSACGLFMLLALHKLVPASDAIAAISAEAFDCRNEFYNDLLNKVRPHNGQFITSRNLQKMLQGSKIAMAAKSHVQDPYSFRCVPQVHGASKDALAYVRKVFETEINSVTDNPTVFAAEERILSGGNFHGQPLALALDFACMAMAELGSISERRIYKLLSGQRGLPVFLATEPGVNSGFMIVQYSAASIVSANKIYCTPASIDSIDSSNGQEDHVSMGANAANKALRVLENLKTILSLEYLTAAQALDFKKTQHTSEQVQNYHAHLRKKVPFLQADAEMHPFILKATDALTTLRLQADENGLILKFS